MNTDLTKFIARQRQQILDTNTETDHKLKYYRELIETYEALVDGLKQEEVQHLENEGPPKLEYFRTKLERIETNSKLVYNRIMFGKYATLAEEAEAKATAIDREVAANYADLYWKVKKAIDEAKVRKVQLNKQWADLDELIANNKPIDTDKTGKAIIYGLLRMADISQLLPSIDPKNTGHFPTPIPALDVVGMPKRRQ